MRPRRCEARPREGRRATPFTHHADAWPSAATRLLSRARKGGPHRRRRSFASPDGAPAGLIQASTGPAVYRIHAFHILLRNTEPYFSVAISGSSGGRFCCVWRARRSSDDCGRFTFSSCGASLSRSPSASLRRLPAISLPPPRTRKAPGVITGGFCFGFGCGGQI